MKVVTPDVWLVDPPHYLNILTKLERIGRVCYKSEDKIGEGTAESFIRGIIKRGHLSVIEHASLTVHVVCDRGVSHEIVRHRLASYSQESTRYCDYASGKHGTDIQFIDIATGFKYDLNNPKDCRKYAIWNSAMEDAERHYRQMIEAGAKPEEARSVLPNSLKTEIVMTMDMREWMHFIHVRTDKAAHPQMREIASAIHNLFKAHYPVFVENL